jgi:hypothetical protein
MTKKYILKPGKHQFAPGSHAVHDNDNLSDDEARWYLEKYPHIAQLFEKNRKVGKSENLGQLADPPQIDEQESTADGINESVQS